MKVDVINDGPNFLFFAVAFQGLRFGDNITIFKKQIKELVKLGLYLKFKVALAMIASLHGFNQTGTDGFISLVMGFDHVNKVQLPLVEGLQVIDTSLVHGRVAH